jgi:hypothetical protein
MTQYYHREWSEVERLYYDFQQNNRDVRTLFPFIENTGMQYTAKYILANEFHRRLHPYSFLRKGDYAVVVGVRRDQILHGLSPLFKVSALIGDIGHVWAVEPDSRNVAAIRRFITENSIRNITIIPKMVWKERTQLEVNCYGKHDLKIETDTLDNIIAGDIKRAIRFVDLTIRSADTNALWGAERILQQADMRMAFPVQDTSSDVYRVLGERGFRIALVDSPQDSRHEGKGLCALAGRFTNEELTNRGFKPVEIAANNGELQLPGAFASTIGNTETPALISN